VIESPEGLTLGQGESSAVCPPSHSAGDVVPELARHLVRVLLFALVYFDSRAWFTKSNFVEVPGAQEVFLTILVLYFLIAVLPKFLLRPELSRGGWFVLTIIFSVLLFSSGGAYLVFGQPLYAGMIEQRRVLGYLIFFPIAAALRSRLVSTRTLLNYVTVAAVLCVINAGVYYLTVSSAQAVESLVSETDARADRTPIGTGFILISLCYVLSRYVEKPKLKWAVLWFVFVFDVIVLEQGRQTIIAVALASAFLLIQSRAAVKQLLITSGWSFLAVLPFIWSSVVRTWQKYVFLFQLLGAGQNLRVDTIHTVMSQNLLVPHGALWAQWRDGFSAYFGPNFFLSDIGLFGELFCYGGVLLALLLIWYYGYLIYSVRAAEWNVVSRTCFAAIFILASLHIFQPVLEHGGFDVGILLALLGSERRAEFVPRTELLSNPDEWVQPQGA